MLESLLAADGAGDWNANLQVIQDFLPIFREFDMVHYLQYASWYLQKMRKVTHECLTVNLEFKKGKCAVKTSSGFFKDFHLI